MSQIGQNSDPVLAIFDNKRHTIDTVMWRGHRMHRHVSKRMGITGSEQTNPLQFANFLIALDSLERATRDVDRDSELALKNPHAPCVVAMVVRDKQGIHIPNVSSMASQPFLRLFSTDPGIKQKTYASRFDEEAVSITTGLQRDDFHGQQFYGTIPFWPDELAIRTESGKGRD